METDYEPISRAKNLALKTVEDELNQLEKSVRAFVGMVGAEPKKVIFRIADDGERFACRLDWPDFFILALFDEVYVQYVRPGMLQYRTPKRIAYGEESPEDCLPYLLEAIDPKITGRAYGREIPPHHYVRQRLRTGNLAQFQTAWICVHCDHDTGSELYNAPYGPCPNPCRCESNDLQHGTLTP